MLARPKARRRSGPRVPADMTVFAEAEGEGTQTSRLRTALAGNGLLQGTKGRRCALGARLRRFHDRPNALLYWRLCRSVGRHSQCGYKIVIITEAVDRSNEALGLTFLPLCSYHHVFPLGSTLRNSVLRGSSLRVKHRR